MAARLSREARQAITLRGEVTFLSSTKVAMTNCKVVE